MNETADEVFNLRARFWGVNNNSSVTQPTGSAGIWRFVGCFVGMKMDQRL
jgi:hypothetical protein